MEAPLIITVGLTGSRIGKQQTPHIPITPDETTRSGIEAWKAGVILCLTTSGIPGRNLSIEERLAPLGLG